jgi:uroporphyrinogen-III synthase
VSLAGKRILVTRPLEQAGEFVAEVERRGAQAIVLPTIRILPPDNWEACDRSIREIASFDAVVFTSANAAQFFCARCAALSSHAWKNLVHAVYAVGEKTARALDECGIAVTRVPERHSGSGLLSMLSDEDIRGKSFLLPRGDRAREDVAEGLVRRGGQVTSVTVYRTDAPSDETGEALREAFRARRVDVATFFSPSAVVHLLEILDEGSRQQLGASIWTAVIGETTSAALTERGIPITISAPHATAASLVEAIERYLVEGTVPA